MWLSRYVCRADASGVGQAGRLAAQVAASANGMETSTVLKDSGNVLTLTRNSGSGSLTVSGVFVPYQHEI